MRFIIADDSTFVLRQFRHYIANEFGYEIISEVNNAADLLKAGLSLSPDFIITDIEMGGNLSGMDAAIEIKSKRPQIKIICLTMHNISSWIYQMQLAGISGYVYKTTNLGNLKEAIDFANEGRFYVDAVVIKNLLNEVAKFRSFEKDSGMLDTKELQDLKTELNVLLNETKQIKEVKGFIPNERQILLLSATIAGHKFSEVAQMLEISPRQLSNIKREMFDLTETKSTPELISLAQRAGWI